VVRTPTVFRVGAVVWFCIAATSTCFGVAASLALGISPTAQLLFAFWTATLGVAFLHGPRLWLAKVEYLITEGHVISRRGPFRRVISRAGISYARIYWQPDNPDVGDIELVRAVPTGAMRRRLLLRLSGLAAPDKVWAIVRGSSSHSESNAGKRCMSQRLDDGERVLWSARPRRSWRRYVPNSRRRLLTALAAVTLVTAAVGLAIRIGNVFGLLVTAGLFDNLAGSAFLVLGVLIAGSVAFGVSGYMLYFSVVLPALDLDRTYYLVTNHRVLIQREHEELHLDRQQIVDVIESPTGNGLHNVFLVLDGPHARALEVGAAFGESERDANLKPVLECLLDAESVSSLLLNTRPSAPPPWPSRHGERPAT
jgi:hypothetical protein